MNSLDNIEIQKSLQQAKDLAAKLDSLTLSDRYLNEEEIRYSGRNLPEQLSQIPEYYKALEKKAYDYLRLKLKSQNINTQALLDALQHAWFKL